MRSLLLNLYPRTENEGGGGESKNLMNTEDKRVSTRRNESKEAPERKRLLERSAFQWAMSLLTSAFGTALTLYLIHRL